MTLFDFVEDRTFWKSMPEHALKGSCGRVLGGRRRRAGGRDRWYDETPSPPPKTPQKAARCGPILVPSAKKNKLNPLPDYVGRCVARRALLPTKKCFLNKSVRVLTIQITNDKMIHYPNVLSVQAPPLVPTHDNE